MDTLFFLVETGCCSLNQSFTLLRLNSAELQTLLSWLENKHVHLIMNILKMRDEHINIFINVIAIDIVYIFIQQCVLCIIVNWDAYARFYLVHQRFLSWIVLLCTYLIKYFWMCIADKSVPIKYPRVVAPICTYRW